jgi:hypothetical protein
VLKAFCLNREENIFPLTSSLFLLPSLFVKSVLTGFSCKYEILLKLADEIVKSLLKEKIFLLASLSLFLHS